MTAQKALPPGMYARHPTMDDVEAVAELINVCALAEGSQADTEVEDIRNDWQMPGFDLATQAWTVWTAQGQLVGYEEGRYDEDEHVLEADGYVHPDYTNQGIGSYLLSLMAEKAHDCSTQQSASVKVQAGIDGANQAAHQLFAAMDYRVVRHFWRMQIEMQSAPTVMWPEGLLIRPFIQGKDDEAVYHTVQEAFKDHWGYTTPTPYEDWYHHHIEREGFDPTLWFVACDGDEMAGAVLSRIRAGNGWVSTLAVRRPWRKRGLGMALLQTAFAAFYQRGIPVVGLGVDAENLTGATRLYERAGMHPIIHYAIYEKVIGM